MTDEQNTSDSREDAKRLVEPLVMCHCGNNPAKEPHSCPYAEELAGNDDPEYCICCDDCMHECCMDI